MFKLPSGEVPIQRTRRNDRYGTGFSDLLGGSGLGARIKANPHQAKLFGDCIWRTAVGQVGDRSGIDGVGVRESGQEIVRQASVWQCPMSEPDLGVHVPAKAASEVLALGRAIVAHNCHRHPVAIV